MFTKDEIFSSSELVINVVLRSAFQDTYKGTRYELILSLKATSTMDPDICKSIAKPYSITEK